MARMLESSDHKFKTTMLYMLRDLMQKVANMQEQVGNLSKEMKILRKNKKKMNARDKKTVMEMKNIFDGHISRLDMAEKKSELKTVHYNLQN